MVPYKYSRPLDKAKSEIRLLRIRPGPSKESLSEDLQCTIEYASLDSCPVYKALSYTWSGKVDDPALAQAPAVLHINSNHASMDITPNLNAALRYLRPVYGPPFNEELILWVDAICINQKDNFEKGWQVAQMQRVYSQASEVIVWLGPPADGSNIAINTLLTMRRFALRASGYEQSGTSNVDMNNVPVDLSEQAFNDQAVATSFGRMFQKEIIANINIPPYPIQEITKLFSREWWGRVWVWQELVMAKEVVFACGNDRIVAGEGDASVVFGTFMATWDQNVEEHGLQVKTLDQRPWTMIDLRLIFTQTGRLRSLRWLLQESHLASLGATDPRDHIYPLLLLAEDRDNFRIKVDYNIPYQKLYATIAKKYLERGELWFLPYCENDPNDQFLPSWVPDWSKTRGLKPLVSDICANNDTKVSCKFSFMDQILGRHRIHLLGVVVGTIEWTSSVRPKVSISDFESHRDALLDWVRANYQALLQCPAVVKDRNLASNAHMNACWTFLGNNIALPNEFLGLPEAAIATVLDEAFRFVLDGVSPDPTVTQSEQLKHRVDSWCHCMMETTNGRRLFYTDNGEFGLGEYHLGVGDEVVIFSGAPAPTAIRAMGSGGSRIVSNLFLSNLKLQELLKDKHKFKMMTIQ